MADNRTELVLLPVSKAEKEWLLKKANGKKLTRYIREKLGMETPKIGVPFGKKNALKKKVKKEPFKSPVLGEKEFST